MQEKYGVSQLGLRGAAVGATVGDDEFADPKFHPFWAKAEELGVVIFLHPQGTPDVARRLAVDDHTCALGRAPGWIGIPPGRVF